MDYRELGVSRRGGVIVECFNADEVTVASLKHLFLPKQWSVNKVT